VSEPREVSAYERRFAEATGASHAVAYGFARHALRGIVRGLGIGPGDRVVLAPLTCRVVVLALLAEGVELAYADVDPDTLNLDPTALRGALRARCKAVLFQHTYGSSGGLAEIAEIAGSAGVALIEDRAQCLPLAEPLRGVAAIYSNNLRKPLPAGSGGVAITQDAGLASALRADAARLPRPGRVAELRRNADTALQRLLLPRFYWPLYALARRTSPTYRRAPLREEIAAEIDAPAFRPSIAQERAGERWLARAPVLAALSAACAQRYAAALAPSAGAAYEIPRRAAAGPLYYFPLRVRDKRALLAAAERARLELIAWPVWAPIFPLESVEALAQYGYAAGSCPAAERLARELVGLPTDRPADEALIALVRRHGTQGEATHWGGSSSAPLGGSK
jgi:dTDP-4-amino-4,6-dideoxygalactose transaminase